MLMCVLMCECVCRCVCVCGCGGGGMYKCCLFVHVLSACDSKHVSA